LPDFDAVAGASIRKSDTRRQQRYVETLSDERFEQRRRSRREAEATRRREQQTALLIGHKFSSLRFP
jgi:hypothetical protein